MKILKPLGDLYFFEGMIAGVMVTFIIMVITVSYMLNKWDGGVFFLLTLFLAMLILSLSMAAKERVIILSK